jgi:hypothetical protein
MTLAGLASARGLAVAVAAGGAGLAALRQPGSLFWGALWPVAVLAACHGYGRALERATGQRVGVASTIIAGLAVLVTGSIALGRLGVLGLEVELGAIVLGLLCCGLAPLARERIPGERAAIAGGIAVVAALAAVAIARLDLVIADGLNHTFVIKRLWDTGQLGHLPHQLGTDPVAEAYFAIAAGSQAAAIFGAAVAPMLVVGLLFERLAAGGSRPALFVFCALAVPIVVVPTMTSQWLAVALHAAAFFALGDAIAARRIGWHAIACAVALAATRHEYVLIAVPYVAAAVVLPLRLARSRRAEVALAAGWFAVLVGFQLALAVPPRDAIVNAALLLAVLPFTRGLLGLIGDEPPRGAVAVLCVAAGSYGLAVVLDAIRPAQHDPVASGATWLAVAVCVAAAPAWAAVADRTRARLHPEIVAVVIALFIAATVLAPNFSYPERGKIVTRLAGALYAIKYRPATGAGRRGHRDLRALQAQLPAGAAIGFWGQSAAELDFRRNQIVDISWPVNRHRDELYLQMIEPRSLRGKDYVLVERVKIATPTPGTLDPWTSAQPTARVDDLLDRVACIDLACAYAVRR